MHIGETKLTDEAEDARGGQPRGTTSLVGMSVLGAGLILLVALLIFAF